MQRVAMPDIDRRVGEEAYTLVSRCFGFEDTDMGRGLTSELIRDADEYGDLFAHAAATAAVGSQA